MAGKGHIRCAKCGSDNREGRKYCAQCGAPMPARCPHCGASFEPTEQFCGECGNPLPSWSPPAPARTTEVSPIRVTPETAAAEALEGERKTVTALFADIKGSTE